MASRSVVGSATAVAFPALLAALLIGFTFGKVPEPDDPDAVVETQVEEQSSFTRFRTSRSAKMRSPEFWVAFAVGFVVVEVAGTMYLVKRAPRNESARLEGMAAVVKKQHGSDDDA